MTASVNFVCPHGGRVRLSKLAFGAAPIGNMACPIEDTAAVEVVRAAVDAGFRYVDVAPLYGHGLAERRVGVALQGLDGVTLSTKAGRLLVDCGDGDQDGGIYVNLPQAKISFDYGYDGIMRSYDASRRRIGRPIDILYIHDVDVATHGSVAASEARIAELFDGGGWKALHELRQSGEVLAIGAGVNDVRTCMRLLDLGDPDLLLLAGRYTLLDQTAGEELLPRCQARGVGVAVGGPFNSGILATGAIEGAWYDYAPASPEVRARVNRLEVLVQDHGVPLAAAALQFPLRHDAVVTVVAGARTVEEVECNSALFDAAIPDALWTDLFSSGLLEGSSSC